MALMTPKEIYKKNIYLYCDDNVKEEILFANLTNLWPVSPLDNTDRSYDISPKNLAILTSEIIGNLMGKGVLREVRYSKKHEGIFYPCFRIMRHKRLVELNNKTGKRI